MSLMTQGLKALAGSSLRRALAHSTKSPTSGAVTGALSTNPKLCLVDFHSAFNALGVTLVLPFAGRFASLIEQVCPEDENSLVRHLGSSLEGDDLLSRGAAHSALTDITKRAFARHRDFTKISIAAADGFNAPGLRREKG